ncbi:MAG: alanine racemase [Sphingomicrobium sp.]
MHRPLRLIIDRSALISNWRWLAARAGVASGAAIKADGYGLGAREALRALYDAGCRDFFVSTWWEARELGAIPSDASLMVLHGVGPNDVDAALALSARPVLNSPEQVARWKEIAPQRPCDVMVDTGMNRLGVRVDELEVLKGLAIDTLMSHLACADEDHPLNALQLKRFREVAVQVAAQRYSLANSAGICLGVDYAFDLVRPGLALYGGIPRDEAAGHIQQVAQVEAQIVQRRTVRAGETCGYGATFVAETDTEAAILNIGYADGYLRGFSARGRAFAEDAELPVLGRVSMDLIAVDCSADPALREGDWVRLDYDLPWASAASGLSQYELLTGLGGRFERIWR